MKQEPRQSAPSRRRRRPGERYNASTGSFESIEGSEAGAPEGSRNPEAVAEDVLAGVIEGINEDVALINASITALETQIDQASNPDEIAALLDQLPALITEKYRRLREALEERFASGRYYRRCI